MISQIRALVGAIFAREAPAPTTTPEAAQGEDFSLWAEVQGGVVVAVHRWPAGLPPPAFAPDVATALEITHHAPRPAPGWTWEDAQGFQPPEGA